MLRAATAALAIAALAACAKPPPPGWHLAIEAPVRRATLSPAGIAIVATDAHVIAALDGRELWRRPVNRAPWLVPLADGTVVSRTDDGLLMAIEAATGVVRWQLGVPIESEEPLGDDEREILGRFRYSAPRGLASAGDDRALLLVEDGRLYDVTPSRCAGPNAACTKLRGRIAASFSGAVDLTDAGDTIVASSVGEVLFTERDGGLVLRGRVPGFFGGTAVWGSTAAVALDSSVLTLSLARCRSVLPVALSRSCAGCVSPPPGCVTSSAAVAGLLPYPPARLADGVAVNAAAASHLIGGAPARLELDGIGPFVEAPGGRLRTVSAHPTDRTLRVLELDPASGARRERVLPFASSGLVITHDVLVSVSGARTLVAMGKDIAVLEL